MSSTKRRGLPQIRSAALQAAAQPRPAPESLPFVALVRAPIVSAVGAFNNEATPAIALASLGAYIGRQGYRYEIVDAIAEGLDHISPLRDFSGYQLQGLTLAETVMRIPEHSNVIAVSAMFSGEWPVARQLLCAIRRRFPNSLIIGGGEHITALTEFSLRQCPALDLCVKGEGEHALFLALEQYRSGGDFSEVPSVAYLDAQGRYVETSGLVRVWDIDNMPSPAWPPGYLERFWEAGKSYGIQSERDMPIMASRGCPYQCTFCSSPTMWSPRYSLRDIDVLIKEIQAARDKYGITALQFYDLTAITRKSWTQQFCRRLLDEGIHLKWSLPSGTRSEALDFETLSLLKQTGCNYLVYAPESGSEDTLARINKRVKKAGITQSVLWAKQLGIVVRTNLIIGFPHETRRHVFDTVRYGLYLALRGADEVSINIFSPYPGTAIFRELLAAGKLQLTDEYFLALTSLNSKYATLDPLTCNPHMGARELAVYRLAFMLTNYALGYLLNPSRILRTVRNTLFAQHAATVFEHRLKDAFGRSRWVVALRRGARVVSAVRLRRARLH